MKLKTFKDEAMTQSNLDDVDHDRMAAHALMQAIGEIGTRGIQDADEITNRADEIMTGWGFGSGEEI